MCEREKRFVASSERQFSAISKCHKWYVMYVCVKHHFACFMLSLSYTLKIYDSIECEIFLYVGGVSLSVHKNEKYNSR